MTGKTLLHYEILELIGRGGMGEVYRARDTKLSRDVAIKILPAEFALDSDRLARFQREAKVLASLHHPNIASIFGFETTDEATFLVMELVEGRDLAEVLSSGPLPVDEAIDIARQIAEGLEEAHEKGIIHRDLKPANVKLTPDGKVKVLDFGLARAITGQSPVEEEISSGQTLTAPMTQMGTVLGTAAYMSPEQARGREVDRRADIWAFGVILFEMLTGRRLFEGETASDTLAGILKSEPDWTSLPAALPFQVDRVLRRCLAKDPRQRLRDIGEARVRLDDPTAESGLISGQLAAIAEGGGSRLGRLLPWGLFAVAVAAAIFLGLNRREAAGPVASPVHYRFELALPDDANLPVVSPDGRRFAYLAEKDDKTAIWIRSFEEPEGRPLNAAAPGNSGPLVWTPDGASLLYMEDDKLYKVKVDGGSPLPVCEAPPGWQGISCAPDGSILMEISTNPESDGWYLLRPGETSLERIPRPLELTEGQSRAGLHWLPDSQHFVFIQKVDGLKQAWLTRVGQEGATPLFPTETRVVVDASGHYVFSRKGQLLIQSFAPDTFLPVGETRVMSEEVALFEPNGRLSASVSNQGTIIYSTFKYDRDVAWYDREGQDLGKILAGQDIRECNLSPDGRLLAVVFNDRTTGTGELWVQDLDRNLANRLTHTPYAEFHPVWSPDSRQIAYTADAEGPPNLFVIDAEGGPAREVIPYNGMVQYASEWTGNGNLIIYSQFDPRTGGDLWTVGPDGGESRELVRTEAHELDAAVSPDGQWLAFRSTQTGTPEIYLRPFDREVPPQRVSNDLGRNPRWDGNRRLFYEAQDNVIMSVELEMGKDRLEIGRPVQVLTVTNGDIQDYCLHPDGRLLVIYRNYDVRGNIFNVIAGWD
jgi:Tol biopolymer transport system component